MQDQSPSPTTRNESAPKPNQGREPFLHRMARRSLTVTLVFVLATLCTACLPLLLLVAGVVDVLSPRRTRFAFCRGLLFFVSLLAMEAIAICAVTLVWLLHLLRRNPQTFERHNRSAQTLWSSTLYRIGERLFSLRTHIEGAIPPPHPDAAQVAPLLVFVRHSSTADTVLPVLILANRGYRLRYVLKRELLFDPCLDIVGQRLRNCFVSRGGKDTDQDLRGVLDLATDMTSGDALVIYPEGTRFTAQKRERTLARLRSHGPQDALTLAESLQHTLPPLQRGPLQLLRENQRADLVLMAHCGLEPAGSLKELLAGDLIGEQVFIHFEHIPFAALPKDPDAQRQFLSEKWRNIDAWIAAHKQRDGG